MATSHFDAVNAGALAPAGVEADRLALIALDRRGVESRMTYGELDARADAVARGLLGRGLRRGDSVAVMSANCPEFLLLLLGALRAGITVVLVNYKFPKALSDFVLEDSGATHVFCDAEHRSQVPPHLTAVEFGAAGEQGFDAWLAPGRFDAVTPRRDEVAVLMYTSGSTGRPKGVKLSHHGQIWVVRARLANQADAASQRYLVAAPLYHMNALALCQLALGGGSTIVLLPAFETRQYVAAATRYQATWLTVVPPMMAMILRDPVALEGADLSHVRVVRMGSAPASQALIEDILALMPHARVINSYGTTEGGPVTFGPHPDGRPYPPLSVGWAHPEVPVRLVDEHGREADQGVLHLKSPAMMLGYHNRPDRQGAITADGYYVTGDVLRRDAEGFFYFVGRDDDMFVCGGENVFPAEVEAVLEMHPDIEQACVVAVPDEIKGHKPVAFVVLRAGRVLTEEAIKAHALAHAPAYQHPRRVWVLPALPLIATSKVDRKALLQQALDTLKAGGTAAA